MTAAPLNHMSGEERFKSYLEAAASRGEFNGSALIMREGHTLIDRGFGIADRSTDRPNEPRTMFQIASVSKQFTAVAVLFLQERRQLSVEDKISKWIPDCPREWEPIRIHHLLSHTSGIVHWRDLPELDLTVPMGRGDLVRLFQTKPLKFHPGEGWAYSSPAYVLLAHIVEQVSRESYANFLHRAILRPLGLSDTVSGSDSMHPGRRARGYADGDPVRSVELDALMIGAGDIWSTTHDLRLWDQALASPGQLLNRVSLQAMFTAHARLPESAPGSMGTMSSYGYGWFLEESGGLPVRYHTGDNPGFKSINAHIPDLGAVVILLANDERSDVGAIGEHVITKVTGRSSGGPARSD